MYTPTVVLGRAEVLAMEWNSNFVIVTITIVG